jgi:hypothetical protein
MPVHPRKPLLALTYRPTSNSGANSSSSSTALTVYQNEPLLDGVYDDSAVARIATYILAVGGVLLLGWWTNRRAADTPAQGE